MRLADSGSQGLPRIRGSVTQRSPSTGSPAQLQTVSTGWPESSLLQQLCFGRDACVLQHVDFVACDFPAQHEGVSVEQQEV